MVHITLFVAFYFTSSQTKLWSYGKNGLEIQNSFLDLQPIHGTIAQLVEQRTENPCVAGSIPAGTTKINANFRLGVCVFCFAQNAYLSLTRKK
jgi:hypothetical protein